MDYIAYNVEGSDETAIIDILLDHDLLIFIHDKMMDEKALSCRNPADNKCYIEHSFWKNIIQ